ncbi:MAG: hypothetical protein OHK0039_45060 [Bacteroidia bacterium]
MEVVQVASAHLLAAVAVDVAVAEQAGEPLAKIAIDLLAAELGAEQQEEVVEKLLRLLLAAKLPGHEPHESFVAFQQQGHAGRVASVPVLPYQLGIGWAGVARMQVLREKHEICHRVRGSYRVQARSGSLPAQGAFATAKLAPLPEASLWLWPPAALTDWPRQPTWPPGRVPGIFIRNPASRSRRIMVFCQNASEPS